VVGLAQHERATFFAPCTSRPLPSPSAMLPSVERIQPELDQMLFRVQNLDEQAATCARRLAEELGTEPNLRGLVRVLDKAEAQQLQGLANRVTIAARNVQDVLKKNRALIENEATYINGTLTLIAKAAVQSAGPFTTKTSSAILVDQAA